MRPSSRLHVVRKDLVAALGRVVQPLLSAEQVAHLALNLRHGHQVRGGSGLQRLAHHGLSSQHGHPVGGGALRVRAGLRGGGQTQARGPLPLSLPDHAPHLGVDLLQQALAVLPLPVHQRGQVNPVHHLVHHPRAGPGGACPHPLSQLGAQPREVAVRQALHLAEQSVRALPHGLVAVEEVVDQQVQDRRLLRLRSDGCRVTTRREGSSLLVRERDGCSRLSGSARRESRVLPPLKLSLGSGLILLRSVLHELDVLLRATHLQQRVRSLQQVGDDQEPVPVVVRPHHRRAAARHQERGLALTSTSLSLLRGERARQPVRDLPHPRVEGAGVVRRWTHHRGGDSQRPRQPVLSRPLARLPVPVSRGEVGVAADPGVQLAEDLPLSPLVPMGRVVRSPGLAKAHPASVLRTLQQSPDSPRGLVQHLLHLRRQHHVLRQLHLSTRHPQQRVLLHLELTHHLVERARDLAVPQVRVRRGLNGKARVRGVRRSLALVVLDDVRVQDALDLRLDAEVQHHRVLPAALSGLLQHLLHGLLPGQQVRALRGGQLAEVLQRQRRLLASAGPGVQQLVLVVLLVAGGRDPLRLQRRLRLLAEHRLLLLAQNRRPQRGAHRHARATSSAVHRRTQHGVGVDVRPVHRRRQRRPQVTCRAHRRGVRELPLVEQHGGELVARQVAQGLGHGLSRLLHTLSEPVHQRRAEPRLLRRHLERRLVDVVVGDALQHALVLRRRPRERQHPSVRCGHQLRRGQHRPRRPASSRHALLVHPVLHAVPHLSTERHVLQLVPRGALEHGVQQRTVVDLRRRLLDPDGQRPCAGGPAGRSAQRAAQPDGQRHLHRVDDQVSAAAHGAHHRELVFLPRLRVLHEEDVVELGLALAERLAAGADQLHHLTADAHPHLRGPQRRTQRVRELQHPATD